MYKYRCMESETHRYCIRISNNSYKNDWLQFNGHITLVLTTWKAPQQAKNVQNSLHTRSSTFMMPSSTGWVQSMVNFKVAFFFCCFFDFLKSKDNSIEGPFQVCELIILYFCRGREVLKEHPIRNLGLNCLQRIERRLRCS